MAQIYATYDQLKSLSKRFIILAEKYTADSREMKNLVEQLNSVWKGTEFDEAIHYFNQIDEFNKPMIDVLQQIGKSLQDVSESYFADQTQLITNFLADNNEEE